MNEFVVGWRKASLRLQALLDLNDASQSFNKLLKCACRKHDRVPAPAHIFSYLKKPAALVFFEIEKKYLSLDLNFFGRERVLAPACYIRIYHILPCLRGSFMPAIGVDDSPDFSSRRLPFLTVIRLTLLIRCDFRKKNQSF